MKRHQTLTAIAATLAATLLSVTHASAGGANADSGTATAPHCVATPEAVQVTCFDTFRKAISFASGGRINNAPTSARAAADDQGLQQRLASTKSASGYVIAATLYDYANYTGPSLTVWTPRPCKDGNGLDFSQDLKGIGWANRVSSLQPWANCWIKLFKESGAVEGPYKTNTPDVGNYINNRAVRIELE
ncbi:hypothetical protein [Wenjunlia tyrosinilytica]|nr:hypothetical protein [Wenjunlia tyrosinilytica]